MYDLNLPSNDVTSHLRPARRRQTGAITGIIAALGKRIAALAAAYARQRLRRETVRQLETLPDHALRDIGLPRSEIWKVASDLVNEAARTPRGAARR